MSGQMPSPTLPRRLDAEGIPSLFGELPDDPAPLPLDEADMLKILPIYPELQAAESIDHMRLCRALERRGLVRIHHWKDDPIQIEPTLYVGRLP